MRSPYFFFFSSRRRHTRSLRDWSSDVCSSDLGWYDKEPVPGVFRSTEPAWNDQNLHEVAAHVCSPLFFAHLRAAIGSSVQQTNCHPFRYGRWLFMHNGYVAGYAAIKRDLVLGVDPSLFPEIKGSSDTEVLFYLALTFGLADDPPSDRK